MASLTYTGTTSQTTAFAATDIYTLAIPTSSVTNVSQQGANVVIQTGATSLTITGVTLAQLANSNFVLQGGGAIQFGDGTANTIPDQFGNTIDFASNNNGVIALGLGGGDTISAGNGNNLIFGGTGITDTADGGDQISTGTGNDTIYGNAGNDTISSAGGTDVIFGGLGTDTINVTGVTAGNTSIYGGGGFSDTVDGADQITVASNTGNLFVTGNAGADTIVVQNSTGNASVFGGIGGDTLTVGTLTGSFPGGDGLGTGNVATGNYLLAGGSSAGAAADVDNINFFGSATGTANVTVFGGVGVNDANDGQDNINVIMGRGTAEIYGNAGNDVINLRTDGVASVYGGIGGDTINISTTAATATARVQVFGGPNSSTETETISLAGMAAGSRATVYGGIGINDSADGADRIIGGASDDLIFGNGGNDTILSGAGNDTLFGGVGNDTFVINGNGTKTIGDFGTGADTLFVGAAQLSGVTGAAATTTGAQLTGTNFTLNVAGNLPATGLTGTVDQAGNGEVDATDGVLFITTGTTAQNINGAGQADFLVGGNANDTIFGGAGNDTIFGGAGNDSITGGAGADFINGGAGNDTYVYTGATDSNVNTTTAAPAGFDTVVVTAGDIFDFAPTVAAVQATPVASGVAMNMTSGTTFIGQLNTAFQVGDDSTNNVEAAVINFTGGQQFLVVDLDSDGAITATDQVIQLTGTVGSISIVDGNVVLA